MGAFEMVTAERLRAGYARQRAGIWWLYAMIVGGSLVMTMPVMMLFFRVAWSGVWVVFPRGTFDGVMWGTVVLMGAGGIVGLMRVFPRMVCPACGARWERLVQVGETGRCLRCEEEVAERVELVGKRKESWGRVLVRVNGVAGVLTGVVGVIWLHGWKLPGIGAGEVVGSLWVAAGVMAGHMSATVVWEWWKERRGRGAVGGGM